MHEHECMGSTPSFSILEEKYASCVNLNISVDLL